MDNQGRHVRDVIASNLVRLMKEHRIKQPKLASKSGVSQATISRMKSGSADPSTLAIERVDAVARGLGCEAWELLIDDAETRKKIVERFLR